MNSASALRWQFALRDVFVVMLLLGIVLAGASQFGMLGLMSGMTLAGTGWGLYAGWLRILLGSLSAAIVFHVTLAFGWIVFGSAISASREVNWQVFLLRYVGNQLTEHRRVAGQFPQALAELHCFSEGGMQLPRGIEYRRAADGFELVALGRDQKPGGAGLDADLAWNDPEPGRVRLPLGQFLLASDTGIAIAIDAVLTGLLAGCLGAARPARPWRLAADHVLGTVAVFGTMSILGVFLIGISVNVH